MYHIAICDDEQGECNKIITLLELYKNTCSSCDFTVVCFSAAHTLYDRLQSGVFFDLLLLDIYMPGKTGIELAMDLRKCGNESPIIFLTTSKEHAVEAFLIDAVQYLIKPLEQSRFFSVLDKVFGQIAKDQRGYLLPRIDGEVRRIAIRNLVYSESQNQYQCLHLSNNEEVRVRMTLTQLYESISVYPDFARVGSSYIVHLGYVDSLNSKAIKLITGKEIWLPRGSYSLLKKQYFAFYRGQK